MDELKELLETISKQLAAIDMKLGVIASQGPMTRGMTTPPTAESQKWADGIAFDPSGRPRS